MWEFLDNVLERAGVVAALFTMSMIACGAAVTVLWRQNQRLHGLLEQARKDSASELKALAEDHARQLTALGNRIDELQERRVRETGTMTERVMDHIKHIDQFAAKLEATIDLILQMNRRR